MARSLVRTRRPVPIVPRFHLTQEDEWLVVHVTVPYVKVSDMEFTVVDGNNFTFYCKPYLLKLALPGDVVDDERATASYDPDVNHGTLVIRLPKATPGLLFEGLDLLTVLLQPQKRAMPGHAHRAGLAPLIEELPGAGSGQVDASTSDSDPSQQSASPPGAAASTSTPDSVRNVVSVESTSAGAEATSAWSPADVGVPLVRAEDLEDAPAVLAPVTYGFNGSKSRVFRTLEEFVCILESPDPEAIATALRRPLRQEFEDNTFDSKRYFTDEEDGEEVRACVTVRV
jgi:hypothetical protein